MRNVIYGPLFLTPTLYSAIYLRGQCSGDIVTVRVPAQKSIRASPISAS